MVTMVILQIYRITIAQVTSQMILTNFIGIKNSSIIISRPLTFKGRVFAMMIRFLLIGTIIFSSTCNLKNNNEMDLKTKENIEEDKRKGEQLHPTLLSGTLDLVPNPCLSDPCLPGQVYSLIYENKVYILTIDGNWIWGSDEFEWKKRQLTPGEKIVAEGPVSEHMDIKKNKYFQLEIKSLETR